MDCKSGPLVSILMNCYNGERFLKEAIDSIYMQSYGNWEIIFVDNCSTDNSVEIIKLYDERLKYYKTESNMPLGAARNFGLQFVRGRYLAFLDTDDVWLEDKLAKQLDFISDGTSFIYSPVFQIDKNSNHLRRTTINKVQNIPSLLERYDINMHSTLIDLELVKPEFNETLSYCPDYDLFMTIVARGGSYKALNTPLVKYRIHQESFSSRNTEIKMIEIVKVLKNIRNTQPLLYGQFRESFEKGELKFKHSINAQIHLSQGSLFKASKDFLLLSRYSKKHLLISALLILPLINKLLYKKFLYKYV